MKWCLYVGGDADHGWFVLYYAIGAITRWAKRKGKRKEGGWELGAVVVSTCTSS